MPAVMFAWLALAAATAGAAPPQVQPDPYVRVPMPPGSSIAVIQDAIEGAAAARRQGRSAEDALGAVRAISPTPIRLGPILGTPGPINPRIWAYQRITSIAMDDKDHDLAAAALAGWEKELAAAGGDVDDSSGPGELAVAYVQFGDRAGARRAADLTPEKQSIAWVRNLIAAGDLERASAASQAYDLEADLRRIEAGMRAQRKALLDSFRTDTHRESPAASVSIEELDEARDYLRLQLDGTRVGLMLTASEAGRADIARVTADEILRGTSPRAFLTAPSAVILDPELFACATPGVARSWLGSVEAATNDVRIASWSTVPGLELALLTLLQGWDRIDRDRAARLVANWSPIARAEVSARNGAPDTTVSTAHAFALTHFLIEKGQVERARGIGLLSPADFDQTLRWEQQAAAKQP